MTKQRVLLAIPLAIIGTLLIYSWMTFSLTDVRPTWRQFVGLGLFLPIVYMFFKNSSGTIISTAIHLLLGTINALSLTPSVTSNSYGIKMGSVEVWTPTFQLISFGILILFFIINFEAIVDRYLDYEEDRKSKRNQTLDK
jgi:hypothetical protein